MPEAEGAWSFEGGPLDADVIEDSCWAYDADTLDISSCDIALDKDYFFVKGSPIELGYTVTSADGTVLTEGVDYAVSVYKDGEEQDIDELYYAGSYTVRFEGTGGYSGTIETTITLVWASVDWTILAGQDELGLADNVDSSTVDETDYAFVLGEGNAEYALALMGVAGLKDAQILVTEQDGLTERMAVRLRHSGAGSIVLVGTEEDIGDEARSDLSGLSTNPSLSRIAATSLADAAVRVYNKFADDGLGADGVAYVVASDNPTLAAAVGVDAYENARPVFFCGSDGELDGATRSILKTAGFEAIVVVSDSEDAEEAVEEQVRNRSIDYQALVGSASEVSAQLASEELEALDEDTLEALSEGEATQDLVVGGDSEDAGFDAALAAVHAARTGSYLLLAGDADEAGEAMDATFGEELWESVGELCFVGRRSVVPESVTSGVLSYWYGGYTRYDDVDADAWYAEYVNLAVDAGLLEGYEDDDGGETGEFGPDDELTRADLAVILYTASDEDDADEAVTREELAGALMNYAEYMGYDIDEDALEEIEDATDADEISEEYLAAMEWLYAEDIMTGDEGDSGVELQPQAEATRAEAAKVVSIVNAMTRDL